MAMICMGCGNKENFTRHVYGSREVEATETIDGKTEDVTDLEIDDEQDDYDVGWDGDDYECMKCSSNYVETGYSERDIKRAEWEHTDKDGVWAEDELEEEERDEELGKELMIEDV